MCEASCKKEKSFPQKGKGYMLMGLGNRWRGDDGVGCFIAENFQSDDWYVLDCGTAPEHFISIVEKNRPRYLVIVDTAQMNLKPGEFRVIPPEKIDEFSLTTHNISLSLLISYLEGCVEEIFVIGIQPSKIEDSNRMSKKVYQSATRIMAILKDKKIGEVRKLS